VDPKKIEEMKDCPHPTTLKILQGFLGLTGSIESLSITTENFWLLSPPYLRKNLSIGMQL